MKDEVRRFRISSTARPEGFGMSPKVTLLHLVLTEEITRRRPNQPRSVLPLAVRDGKDAVARLLLRCGADANGLDESWKSALTYAIEVGNIAMVRDLLDRDASCLIRDGEGMTDLHRCAMSGNCSVIQLCLDHGASVNAKNGDGVTLLMIAVRYDQITVVELLIKNGANIWATSYLHENALHIAAGKGNYTIAKLLLAKDTSEINMRDHSQMTALHRALNSGVDEMIRLLLERGADVNIKDRNGYDAIQIAAMGGQTAIVSFLMDNERDLDLKFELATKTLQVAIENGQAEVVRRLFDLDVSITERECRAAILRIADRMDMDSYYTTVRILLERLPNVVAVDHTKETLLHEAVRCQTEHLLRMLLQNKPALEVPNSFGETALQIAAGKGKAVTVKLLLDAGADINAKTPDLNYTALHKAAEAGHIGVVQVLIKTGADVNAELSDGRTPLHLASAKNEDDIVALLFDYM
jgi:ankyrin repeat protein